MALATGIFPEDVAGGLPIRNPDGSPTNNPIINNAYVPAPGYVSTCELTALPTDCTARIEARQINAIVSELLAFAEGLDPDGPWQCEKLTNVRDSFNVWITEFADERWVNTTGDTMTGPLHLPLDTPVDPTEAANKKYVDDAIAAAEGLDADAFVNVTGDTMTGALIMSAAPGAAAEIYGEKGGAVKHWVVQYGDATPQTGGNSGSNFAINCFDDAGGNLFSCMSIDRATGTLRVRVDPAAPLGVATKQYVDKRVLRTGDTMTGNLQIIPSGGIVSFGLYGAPLTNVDITGFKADKQRWLIRLGDSGEETGGNAGSGFAIYDFNDAGDAAFPVLLGNRQNHLLTVNAPPVAPLGIATKAYVDAIGAAAASFPAGTAMLFVQTAAPVGWTKNVNAGINDKALRVTNGAAGGGGVNGFSTVMAQTTTGNHTNTLAETPAGITSPWTMTIQTYANGNPAINYPAMTHYAGAQVYTLGVLSSATAAVPPGYSVPYTVSGAADGWTFESVSSGSNGTTATSNNTSGGAHNHPITMNIAYLDVIIAVKD